MANKRPKPEEIVTNLRQVVMPAGHVVMMSPEAETGIGTQDCCRIDLRERLPAETILAAVAACNAPT